MKRAELPRARSRRPRVLVAAAATATLLLSGCGSATTDYAARIDGEVVSQADLHEAAEQWNSFAQQQETPQTMLASLAKAPALEPFFEGHSLTDAALISQFQEVDVSDPSPLLLDFARGRIFEGSAQSLDPAEVQAAVEAVEVEINPRYGTWDAAAGAVVPQLPDWIGEVGTEEAGSEDTGAGN